MDDLQMRNQWPFMKTAIVWFVLFALLIGGLSWARVITLPAWLGFERRAFVASHQYIENKRAAIAAMTVECVALPTGAQKQVLRQRIATERALIPINTRPHGGC